MSLFQRLTRFNGKTFRFRLFQVYERKKEPHFWHTGWKMSCISRIDMRYFIRKFQREISACAKSKFAFYWFRVLFCLLKYRSVLLQKSNVFCFFFFGKSELVFIDNWSFFWFPPARTVCFSNVQSAVNQKHTPIFYSFCAVYVFWPFRTSGFMVKVIRTLIPDGLLCNL